MACVNLESLYVYLANCMHDLASDTELDSEITKWKSCSHKNLDTYPQKGIILNQESKLLKFWIGQFFAMTFKYQYWKFQPRRLKLDGDMAQNYWSVSLEKGTGDW